LYSPLEKEPVLVHGYNCTDMGGEFVFGFNTHDGGNLVTLAELTEETRIVPVDIVEAAEQPLQSDECEECGLPLLPCCVNEACIRQGK